nr:retrovirus-related Pol polyprotein from transposon TNT 1-94 [Tanacetum cinerariifolium]
PHNKTPYELLHGRLPSIGFMRPFGCHVTILNTLDHVGKFQGMVDEGFLVGYSVCSKAFIVFNSRTRIGQETLHVNFMENKPNVAGSGLAWLFDIDSLTSSMNYHPVSAENQTNSHAGLQDIEKKSVSPDIHSSSSGTQTRKQGDKTKNKDKGKSPVESFTGYRDLSAEFEDYSDNSINEFNAAGTIVPTIGQNSPNITNTFSAAGPSNATEVEDIIYSDDEDNVGAEAEFNNLETSITFQMSSMGELTFFLGLQVKKKKDEIFISQDKYVVEILRKFGLTERKTASTPIDTEKPLLKDPDGEDVDVHTYSERSKQLLPLHPYRLNM